MPPVRVFLTLAAPKAVEFFMQLIKDKKMFPGIEQEVETLPRIAARHVKRSHSAHRAKRAILDDAYGEPLGRIVQE